jgi:hypothetical protein
MENYIMLSIANAPGRQHARAALCRKELKEKQHHLSSTNRSPRLRLCRRLPYRRDGLYRRGLGGQSNRKRRRRSNSFARLGLEDRRRRSRQCGGERCHTDGVVDDRRSDNRQSCVACA